MVVVLLEQTSMGIGKRQPDGKKIVKLREQNGLKQNVLARDARISERLLRDIERRSKPVPASTITAIATALKVPAEEITIETQEASEVRYQQLKLKAVRSASELGWMAEEAHRYWWDLRVDPTSATAKEMQQLLMIIRRLVENVADEFDNEDLPRRAESERDEFEEMHLPRRTDFGTITRLARLQELLDTLRSGGVNVLAASYYHQSLTGAEDKGPGAKYPVPGNSEQIWRMAFILNIYFVPGGVDECEISIDTGDFPIERLESLLRQNKGW
jgi:transcriptional regulator with XRE-family HTH domain